MKEILFFTFCIFVSCNIITSQSDVLENLKKQGWVEIDSISVGSKKWSIANHSNKEWMVNCNEQGLYVSNFVKLPKVVYSLDNGYLQGTDRGEWGGKLSFYPQDTSNKQIDILDGNIISIFKYKDKIYALEGLSHLDYSNGKIVSLTKDKDKGNWQCKTTIDLKDKPYSYTITKENDLYLVTSKKLLKIRNDKIEEVIINNAFWQSLYPNSIVMVNDVAIIGMRGIITIINIKNKKITNLIKNE